MPHAGLDRSSFDNKSVSFEEHCALDHSMWHYLYFIVLVKVKDPTEFTGPESYVYSMIKVRMYSPTYALRCIKHMYSSCLEYCHA